MAACQTPSLCRSPTSASPCATTAAANCTPMDDAATLVRRLRSPRRLEQLQAVLALEQLAKDARKAECDRLVEAGCMPPLSHLLQGSQALQDPALSALQYLVTVSSRARDAAAPSIPALVSFLRSGISEDRAVTAAWSLYMLGLGSPERSAAMVAAGAHTALLEHTSSCSSARVCAAACSALGSLAANAPNKDELVNAGAFTALAGVLPRASSDSGTSGTSGGSGIREDRVRGAALSAADAIGNLCQTGGPEALQPNAAAAAQATAAGAPAALVMLLRSDLGYDVRHAAARAIGVLADSRHPGTCDAIVAAGGLAALAECWRPNLFTQPLDASGSLELDRQFNSLRALGEEAPRLLARLVDGSPERCAALAGIPCASRQVFTLLASPLETVEMQLLACEVAGCLAACEQGRASLIDFGVASLLQRQTVSEYPAVQRAAASALARLNRALSPAAASSTAAPAAAPEPAAAQPQPQRPRRSCAAPGCGATHGLRRCGGCAAARYCGEACSRAHWREHRAECRRLQAERAAAAAAPPESEP